jgi:hemoglobin-like flavoprotein
VTEDQITRIRACFDEITPRTPELADRFHARLFVQTPRLRPLFPRDLASQKQDFAAGLRHVIKNLHRIDTVAPMLMDIGSRQARLGLTPGDFGAAREALLATLKDIAGPRWNDQLEADWREALTVVASIMVIGASRSRSHAS